MSSRVTLSAYLVNNQGYVEGIRAIPSLGYNDTDRGINSAILRYDGAPCEEPTSVPVANGLKLNEANVVVSILDALFRRPYTYTLIFRVATR